MRACRSPAEAFFSAVCSTAVAVDVPGLLFAGRSVRLWWRLSFQASDTEGDRFFRLLNVSRETW